MIKLIIIRSRYIFICLMALSVGRLYAQQAYVPQVYQTFATHSKSSLLADFSYAGYHYGEKAIPTISGPIVNVQQHGVIPDLEKDQTNAVQHLVDSLGKAGGGVLFFPKGKYFFNMDKAQKNFIKINYSHIVLRGAGDGKDGTVFISGNDLLQESGSYSLSPFLIQTGYELQGTESFWGIDYPDSVKRIVPKEFTKINNSLYGATITTHIIKYAAKGQSMLSVNSTKGLKAHDVVLIGMYNTTDDGNLIKQMIKPYQQFESYETAALIAGKNRAPSYQWLVEIKKIIGPQTLELMQPLRRELAMSFSPVIAKAAMLTEIGIEHIRFDSRWNGAYCHHGCNKADRHEGILMDYGWNAINLCRTNHSWVRNVTITNYANPIYLLDSRNNTLTDVTIDGFDGHSGIKIYSHAADNLIKNIVFNTNFTHVLSGEGNAYGNVFTGIIYTPYNRKPGDFDFHGFANARFSPPGENLFEDIKGTHQISGGGSAFMLPHTGNRNVWWNIEEMGFNENTEVFTSWAWQSKTIVDHPGHDHHKMYPMSILVGFYSPQGKLTIDGIAHDQNTPWVYTEHFNQGLVWPHSLYQQQLKIRTHAKKQ